ncbi:MAG: cob(I)yrinic acid a,c-diamide adenosyltransferase [Candidatus Kapaibacteriota bacterium]
MKIYTKTGDTGETGLFDGTRILKSNLRVDVYGTIDELNSYIGAIAAFELPEKDREVLLDICKILFRAGTELATPEENKLPATFQKLSEIEIKFLEEQIDKYSELLPALKNFILPTGCFESAFVQIARTVCRRAERRVVELEQNEKLNHSIVIILNRLSDFLFVFARYVNKFKGIDDAFWK